MVQSVPAVKRDVPIMLMLGKEDYVRTMYQARYDKVTRSSSAATRDVPIMPRKEEYAISMEQSKPSCSHE